VRESKPCNVLQNLIPKDCRPLQRLRIRFWRIADRCKGSESDSGRLQTVAKAQNLILEDCRPLQRLRIRFWRIADRCKGSESDSGGLQTVAKVQNLILEDCRPLQRVQNPVLEKNQIKQRAPESIFPPEPAANVERFVNRPPLVCVQSPAPAYFCRQVKAVDP